MFFLKGFFFILVSKQTQLAFDFLKNLFKAVCKLLKAKTTLFIICNKKAMILIIPGKLFQITILILQSQVFQVE